MDDLLKLRQFQRYSEDDVKKVVSENDKKRFALRNDPATDRLQIRANQGHTMEVSRLMLHKSLIRLDYQPLSRVLVPPRGGERGLISRNSGW